MTALGPDCGWGIRFLAVVFVGTVLPPIDLRAPAPPPRLPPVPSLRLLAVLFCASAGATSPNEGLAPRRCAVDDSPGSSMATRGFGFGPRSRFAIDF